MKKIIFVTGVTRMREGFVCISGLDEKGKFVRPEIHYPERRGIKKEFLYTQGKVVIKPLAKVELEFLNPVSKSVFHTEDWEIDGNIKPRLVTIPTESEKLAILNQNTDFSLESALAEELADNFDQITPQPLTADLSGFFKLRVGHRREIYN